MVTARPNVGENQMMKTSLPGMTPDEITAALQSSEPAEGEQTIVRPRIEELYSVEIWRAGTREAVVPITKPEITIGRGSRSVSVDLPLKGDPEISRVHATLSRDEQGQYWLTPKGRNPTIVSGREITREEPSPVTPDEKIEICSYSLRIQPK